MLVAGGVLAWLGLIPLIAVAGAARSDRDAAGKLGYLPDLVRPGAGGWNPATHTFASEPSAIYRAYVRQIGAGAVAAGGFITLLKTLPTIVSSFQESIAVAAAARGGRGQARRTERDLPITVVLGRLARCWCWSSPCCRSSRATGVGSKLLLGLLIVVFGFFFVTVSSRIVGLIGIVVEPDLGHDDRDADGDLPRLRRRSAGPATSTSRWRSASARIVCIAAANAGATSQDLKTGYLVGATPRAPADRPASSAS